MSGRRRLWWLPWLLGALAVGVVVGVVIVAVSRGGTTDGERACALVDAAVTEVFGRSARVEPAEADCVIDGAGETVVVHVFGNPVGERHYLASRRAVAETDPSVEEAPVRGGRAFFADDGTTLWAWDPQSRVEFALFAGDGSGRLVELADRVLASRR